MDGSFGLNTKAIFDNASTAKYLKPTTSPMGWVHSVRAVQIKVSTNKSLSP
jgi:hypothetical protein